MQLGTWALVFPELATISTVFALQPARRGRQREALGVPRTGVVIVDQLRAVPAAAGLSPPYVLVGTSMGGL